MNTYRLGVITVSLSTMMCLIQVTYWSSVSLCDTTGTTAPTAMTSTQKHDTVELQFIKHINIPWDIRSASRKVASVNIHFWYVIECNFHSPDYSLWQALTLEHSWYSSSGIGAITRLVPGCSPYPQFFELVKRYNHSDISKETMYSSIYFTPKAEITAGMNDTKYGPGNRPPAAIFWLQQAVVLEDYLVAVDPDFVFRHPLLPPTGYRNAVLGQPYSYLSQIDDPRYWPRTVSTLCDDRNYYGLHHLPPNSEVLLQECGQEPNASRYYDLGIFVPLGMPKDYWQQILPVWESAIQLVRMVLPIQESDMIAMSWAMASLRYSVIVWEPCMTWATEQRWLDLPVTSINPICLHYYAPTEVAEDNEHGMVAGNQFIFTLKTPQQLLEYELKNQRPLIETSFFSKSKFDPSILMSCKGPLLFQHPPLDYLLGTRWFNTDQQHWLWQYIELVNIINKAMLYHRDMSCAVRGSDEKVLRAWVTPGFLPYEKNSQPFLSAFETVYDDSQVGGFYYRPAKWAHWRPRLHSERFLWRVTTITNVTYLSDKGVRSAPVGVLSPGTVVDVVRISSGLAKIIIPVFGWVDIQSLQPNISDSLFSKT